MKSPHTLYSSNHFSLSYTCIEEKCQIFMQAHDHLVTGSLPQTHSILRSVLPSVLKTTCHNQLHLPFHQEVKNTEVGHLFEHILLEYLCAEKISAGAARAHFAGVTTWNWRKNPKGSFNITISIPQSEQLLLSSALKKTLLLTELVLNSEERKSLGSNKPWVTETRAGSLQLPALPC